MKYSNILEDVLPKNNRFVLINTSKSNIEYSIIDNDKTSGKRGFSGDLKFFNIDEKKITIVSTNVSNSNADTGFPEIKAKLEHGVKYPKNIWYFRNGKWINIPKDDIKKLVRGKSIFDQLNK